MNPMSTIVKEVGKHLGRSRHQRGWVEETGKRVRNWKGHFYVYERQPDGTEKRRHRAVILGPKSQMKKWEAERRLQAIIDKESVGTNAEPFAVCTLRWFWENRYRPLKEPSWKPSSRRRTAQFIEHYVIAPFGDIPLKQLTRFNIQTHLNNLGEKYSHSVAAKFRVYLKALLDEAVEQELIERNPARKIHMPVTRKPCKRILTTEEITAIMDQLGARDRLIVRMFLVLGLRPGELFALRRNDKGAGRLRIDESVSTDRLLVEPKTEASATYVWLPPSLEAQLDFWLHSQEDKGPAAFIFPTRNSTPLNVSNYLNQVLKPAAERARRRAVTSGASVSLGFLEAISHQMFRRTCATYMQKVGNIKDIQAHLRHASASTTIGVYVQEIPASVRRAVAELDEILSDGQGPSQPVN